MELEKYEYVLRHAGAAGEVFFYQQLLSIRGSMNERREQMRTREDIHKLNVDEINSLRRLKEQRLALVTMNYSGERSQLSREIADLSREERMQRVSLQRDLSRLSKELMEKEEEYEGIGALFRMVAISRKKTEREQ